jgi:hypothetical protein
MVLALIKLGTSTTGQVLQALKMPVILSLVSASPLAAVPASIDRLSNRLGFSRGVVEMLLPSSTVFLRTGAAMQYAMLAVFVAHLYGHQLTPMEMMTLTPVAVVAALASAGTSGIASFNAIHGFVVHAPVEGQGGCQGIDATPSPLRGQAQGLDIAVKALMRFVNGVVRQGADLSLTRHECQQLARHPAHVGTDFRGDANALHRALRESGHRPFVLMEPCRRQAGHEQQQPNQQAKRPAQAQVRRLLA